MRRLVVLVACLWIPLCGEVFAQQGKMSFEQFKDEWNKELGAIANIKSIVKENRDSLLVDFGEGVMLTVFLRDEKVSHVRIMCVCDTGSGASRLIVATEKLLRVFLPNQSKENRKDIHTKLVKPGPAFEITQDGVKITRVITPGLGWDVDAVYLEAS